MQFRRDLEHKSSTRKLLNVPRDRQEDKKVQNLKRGNQGLEVCRSTSHTQGKTATQKRLKSLRLVKRAESLRK